MEKLSIYKLFMPRGQDATPRAAQKPGICTPGMGYNWAKRQQLIDGREGTALLQPASLLESTFFHVRHTTVAAVFFNMDMHWWDSPSHKKNVIKFII